MAPKQLNFITGNKNKLREVQAILEGTVDLQSQSLDLPELQGTIEEVSIDKCRRAAEAVNGPVLTEDTCLAFKALGDLPGPYIKWFMNAIGHEGLNNLLVAYQDKSAQAICTFCYCQGPGHEPIVFQGRTDVSCPKAKKGMWFFVDCNKLTTAKGKIVPARGPTHFGWDAIFEYEGQTYAEMDPVEKNKISHRYKALEKLKTWLKTEV